MPCQMQIMFHLCTILIFVDTIVMIKLEVINKIYTFDVKDTFNKVIIKIGPGNQFQWAILPLNGKVHFWPCLNLALTWFLAEHMILSFNQLNNTGKNSSITSLLVLPYILI